MTTAKYCKCGKECTTTNTTKSQLKRKTPICKECYKKHNAKHNTTQTHENKQEKLMSVMVHNRNPIQKVSIDKQIQKHLQLNKQEVNIRFYAKYIDSQKIKSYIDINTPTAIQSTMGTGKTKYVIEIIEQAIKTNKTVIYICPNISTINDTAKKLDDVGIIYTKYTDTKYFDSPNIVLSTVDSCNDYLDMDILIVDEVYTVFEEMAFKTIAKDKVNQNLLHHYYRIMQHKFPFILDRYINPVIRLFDAFQKNFQGCVTPFRVVENTYKKTKPVHVLEYDRQRDVQNEIHKLLNFYPEESIAVHFSEEKSAKKLYNALIDVDLDVGLYTSKQKDKIDDYQIMITTSSLSRGNSLCGDSMYLIDSGRTVGVMTLLQMIDRVRDSKSINLYLKEGNLHNDNVNKLYNHHNSLAGHNFVLRIREFLRLVKKMEKHHKAVLQFMVTDTYDTGLMIENIHEVNYCNDLIRANWDRWSNEAISTELIIKMLMDKVEISEETIMSLLQTKFLIEY